MILYILRHANAGKGLSDARRDAQRPLDRHGIEQCRRVGRWMAGQELGVEMVIASPLKRASQTAALVANEIGFEGKVIFDEALRPDAEFSDFRDLLRRHSDVESVLVVGHKPSINLFLSRLISESAGAAVTLKKGALAKLEIRGHGGELEWLMTPRLLEPHQPAATERTRPNTRRK